jgi:hypothetical protein
VRVGSVIRSITRGEFIVTVRLIKFGVRRFLLAGLIAVPLLPGCSPEGTGSIKIDNPEAVRSKVAGPAGGSAKDTEKQAKAKALEAEAGKKHPKLE